MIPKRFSFLKEIIKKINNKYEVMHNRNHWLLSEKKKLN